MRALRRPTDDDWEALYRRERPHLVRVALLITGSPEMAEDAFHTAVERIRPRLADLERPGAYLRTVVVNAARDLRARARRDDTGALPVRLDAGLDTRQLELWEALEQLSERRRTALVLRYYGDLDVREVADVMGIEPDSASSLIHRGLRDLREEMSDD